MNLSFTRTTLSALAMTCALLACSQESGRSGVITPPPPPPPPPSNNPVLYTTLDGPDAVTVPTLGSGIGATLLTSPANDFVAARVNNGFRANAVGERILYGQLVGSQQNVELDRGTMEFWYQPLYDHNNNFKYTIAGTGNWGVPPSPGSLHLGKHNNTNQNKIFLIFYNGDGKRFEHNVVASAYSWKAGDWLLMRITWDFGVAAGVQNLHLYVNGVELPLSGQVSYGPQPTPAERPTEHVYIGSRDLTGTIPAGGLYDEFRLWNRPVPPT